jgi:hypothetical protein
MQSNQGSDASVTGDAAARVVLERLRALAHEAFKGRQRVLDEMVRARDACRADLAGELEVQAQHAHRVGVYLDHAADTVAGLSHTVRGLAWTPGRHAEGR